MVTDFSTIPAAGDGGVPLIDRAVLAEWLGDDDAGIDALLLIFRDSVHSEYQQLKDALARGDLGAYGQTVHRLRGAALSMGARQLAEVAAALNDAARAGDGETCAAGMALLDLKVRLTMAEVPGDPAGP